MSKSKDEPAFIIVATNSKNSLMEIGKKFDIEFSQIG
jgi:hypothetical protein